ncbi:hypothetical protein [Vibrio tapetis]|uniref:Adhesin-like protein n=1 Tax=Vibrio tapetis subsp. tapetis TaxID=1671868 RepID=A0A2N8ZMG6_9VIBR|nr:hypothetical protein [Vibrio tapetis]SON53090.1 Adhesin-like protein [Vibrio tapetis subsp. tapetis]
MFDLLKKHWPRHPLLRIVLLVMGFLVIAFNVKGYDELFHDDPWFGLASPFGILLGCAEIAVLLWTSAVISKWPEISRILKSVIFILVPAFAFLCYSGINSYLSSLATHEIRQVEEVRTRNSNNAAYLDTREKEVLTLREQLTLMRPEREELTAKIGDLNEKINIMSQAASERRLKALDCSAVADCRDSVASFEDQADRLRKELPNLYSNRDRLDKRIIKTEEDLDTVLKVIREQKLSDTEEINQHAGVESNFEMKKAAYEKVIRSSASLFGYIPKDPFGIFVGLVSGLIYPVYFILNLFIALDSPENIQARKERIGEKTIKKERKSTRIELLKKLVCIFRSRLLRKKKATLRKLDAAIKLRESRATRREALYNRMMQYFRVWAHRRTKAIEKEVVKTVEIPVEVEVDKIIEVPIEVEKVVEVVKEVTVEVEVEKTVEVIKEVTVEVEVEKTVEVIKEVPIEIRVEVPVEVDRIVEVPKEVPVFIEKIKKEPEPYFIKDPQVIIHERIIPVPADITGAELEALLNAQHELNRSQRDNEEEAHREHKQPLAAN